ncbi:MAG TPA: hypothetical protein VD970_08200, partial [Acetobacteraceae bacterium]|nr:hypothetical protein [Acetobacteraceae bacterium]
TAELCGYAEFANPSTPPKKYRRKEVSGLMYSGQWAAADNTCPSDDAGGAEQPYATNFEDVGGGTPASLSFSASAADQGDGTYKLTISKDGHPVQGQIWTRWFSGGLVLGQGEASFQTGAISPLGPDLTGFKYFDMGLQVFNGGGWIFGTPVTHRMYVGERRPEHSHKDTWDQVVTHEADDCAQDENDSSVRLTKAAGKFPLDSGGTSSSWSGFAAEPPAAYAGISEPGVVNPTKRETLGSTDCVLLEDGKYHKAQGTVTEELNDEDTDEDAEARAVVPLEWSTPPGVCGNHSAFRTTRGAGAFAFTFRKGQCKVGWVAEIDAAYKITVRFARRVLGSSGPFSFYSVQELTVVADLISEETDWIDVPNQAGWETVAANCSVCRLTSGGPPLEECP